MKNHEIDNESTSERAHEQPSALPSLSRLRAGSVNAAGRWAGSRACTRTKSEGYSYGAKVHVTNAVTSSATWPANSVATPRRKARILKGIGVAHSFGKQTRSRCQEPI